MANENLYYGQQESNFFNTLYALEIALENHFAELLFSNDTNKIVYASNAYALRKRSDSKPWSNQLLPFMNYRPSEIINGTERPLWNANAHTGGYWVNDLQKYLKLTPVTINFESSLFYSRFFDLYYGHNEVIWDNANETVIDFYLTVEDIEGNPYDLKVFGILSYDNPNMSPEYTESDWLERNQINTAQTNFNIQTIIIDETVEAWLPTDVVFEFAHSKGLDPEVYDTTIEFMQEYNS